MKKKPIKQVSEQIAPESDEHFAYIAGYTEGGAPYGVTWEEMDAGEHSAADLRSDTPPTQETPLFLNNVVQEVVRGARH